MRTVAFETSTINPIALAKLGKAELTLTYAIYSVMDAQLFYFAEKHNAFRDPNYEASRGLVGDALKTIGDIYFDNFRADMPTKEFRGCIENDDSDLSHYDIEKHIVAVFGQKGIMLDSESSWFYVDTTEEKAPVLEAWLRQTYPTLDFTLEDKNFEGEYADDKRPESIGNWAATEAIVRNAGIKVTIEMPKLARKSEKEITEYVEEALVALKKTGLPMSEAIALLSQS